MEINNSIDLENAIALLSLKNKSQNSALKIQFADAVDSLKPARLLKAAVNNLADNPGVAKVAIGTIVAVEAGGLSKKLIVGKSGNIFRRIIGTVVELAVARSVLGNSAFIASKGIQLLRKIAK